MKIDELLTLLNTSYYGSRDNIIITWFDKESVSNCLDTLPDDPDVLDEAWERVSDDLQDELNHYIEFHQFQYDLAAKLQSTIEDVEEEWSEDA